MNSVERVKNLCKERGIPVSRLEKELGFANGYISQLRKGVFPSNRLVEIADYFGVSIDYLVNGTEETEKAPTQEGERSKDRDIYRIERAKKRMSKDEWAKQMKIIEASFGDYFSDDYEDDDINE